VSVFSVRVSKPLSVDTDLTVSIYTEQTPTRAAVKSEQVLCIETAAVDNGFFSDKEVGRVSADAYLHYGRPAAGSVTLLSIHSSSQTGRFTSASDHPQSIRRLRSFCIVIPLKQHFLPINPEFAELVTFVLI